MYYMYMYLLSLDYRYFNLYPELTSEENIYNPVFDTQHLVRTKCLTEKRVSSSLSGNEGAIFSVKQLAIK